MRQYEGAWYSQAAIDRSKVRLQRTGYFEDVEVETPAVPGVPDQVDVVVTFKERSAGQFVFGLGFSQLAGLTFSVAVSQDNFLGTGNSVSVSASTNTFSKNITLDRKSVVSGKSVSVRVDLGVRRNINKKQHQSS